MNASTGGDALVVSYFGPDNMVGNDMNFDWVNKDNILSVYQNFVERFLIISKLGMRLLMQEKTL